MIPLVAPGSLLVGSVSVSCERLRQICLFGFLTSSSTTRLYRGRTSDRSHGLSTLSCVWQQVKLSDVSLGIRPQYSLVVDEDVKKNKKTDKQEIFIILTIHCVDDRFLKVIPCIHFPVFRMIIVPSSNSPPNPRAVVFWSVIILYLSMLAISMSSLHGTLFLITIYQE